MEIQHALTMGVSSGTDILIAVIVGIGTGVFSAFAVWWFITIGLSPKIAISPKLAHYELEGWARTQFRVRNEGRRRAWDLKVVVRLFVTSLRVPGVVEPFTLHNFEMASLEPGNAPRWTIRTRRNETLLEAAHRFPRAVAATFAAGREVEIAQLLEQVPQSRLRVTVTATDSFSQARALVIQEFTAADVGRGRYVGKTFELTGDEDGTVGVEQDSELASGIERPLRDSGSLNNAS